MTPADVQHNFEAGHACWDDMDLISGRPTGAVRVSFGCAPQPCSMTFVAIWNYNLELLSYCRQNACQSTTERYVMPGNPRLFEVSSPHCITYTEVFESHQVVHILGHGCPEHTSLLSCCEEAHVIADCDSTLA